MKKLLDILLSALYLFLFGVFICLFHPIQLIAFHSLGVHAQQKVVQALNFCLRYSLVVTGSRVWFQDKPLDQAQPYVVVANHQSMFDIIYIIWYLRRLNPIFVSKIELAKGIPSISLNLRLSGGALIDRKDSRQAVPEISRMAKHALNKNLSPVIFPEGTRSKTGQLKAFAPGGLAILLKNMPSAHIIPVAINGNNKLNPTGLFPLTSFTKVSVKVLDVVNPKDYGSIDELVKALEAQISAEL
jgi:1-acyl-sn-glycerol-3-phosphate acyltransferase